MGWVSYQIKQKDSYFSPPHQPHYSLPHSSPPPLQSGTHSRFNILNNISPSILIIITIVAIVFFISGLLHLLTRFFLRPINRDHSEDLNNVSSPFHGQLQQLFQLHASGLDQLYIDSLPVFFYKTIIGLKKNPFDCAVCLCEFEDDDLLRLLPKCSHAFHVKCIDTWLLSHSNCPLCRGSLVPEFPSDNIYSSNSESSREIVSDISATSSVLGINAVVGIDTQVDFHGEDELGLSCNDISINFSEISDKEDEFPAVVTTGLEEKVIPVKLGKFRNVDIVTEGGEDGSFNSKIVARRCFSMGSLEYSLDENSSLKVPIIPCVRKHTSKKPSLPLKPGHHLAMSECEGFKGFDSSRNIEICGGDNEGTINTENANKKDSFSVSKIWLFSKKEKKTLLTEDSSRRASSFRFPLQQTEVADDLKLKCGGGTRRTVSEIDVSEWEMNVSELGVDEEVGSNMPSFARRTLLWFVGKQNKVCHARSRH